MPHFIRVSGVQQTMVFTRDPCSVLECGTALSLLRISTVKETGVPSQHVECGFPIQEEPFVPLDAIRPNGCY